MIKKTPCSILFFSALSLLLASCEKAESPDRYVNSWIYQEMKTYYLWNDQMPSSPNHSQKPEDFFESLLFNRGQATGDRFSWIQENYVELLQMLDGITPSDIGFEYVGYLKATGSEEVIAQIAYVKPNTNAKALGLKRGDWFTKVNGIALNTSNWRDLLSANDHSATITFVNTASGITTDITVAKQTNYAEDPVFFDQIYNVDGHIIGYLVYNFFAAGPNNSYNKKLNEVFGNFKSAGITELVLDLRYNNGGSMESATLLGSMIVPNLNTNNVFCTVQYNELLQNEIIKRYGPDYLIDKQANKLPSGEAINNVGNSIQKLYVLTSSKTASASELLINSLMPYMSNIFLIGYTTVGKNVGSFSIYEENDPKNKWGMQPITLRYFNKDGKADFLSGFAPHIEDRDNGEKLNLGDPNEQMLKKAIAHITGTYASPTRDDSVDKGLVLAGSSMDGKAWANQVITTHPKP